MFVPYPSPLSASFFYFTTFHGKMEKVFRKEMREPEGSLISFILLFLPQFQRQYPQLLLLFLHSLLPLLED